MPAIRFDDLAALAEVQATGFGGWGRPLTITASMVGVFGAIAGRDRLNDGVPGFLLASVLPRLAPINDWTITGHGSAINLGCPHMRFPAPLAMGETVRGRSRIAAVRGHPRGTIITLGFDVRVEGAAEANLDCTVELLYSAPRS